MRLKYYWMPQSKLAAITCMFSKHSQGYQSYGYQQKKQVVDFVLVELEFKNEVLCKRFRKQIKTMWYLAHFCKLTNVFHISKFIK